MRIVHWEWSWQRWVVGALWWDVEGYFNVRAYLGPLMLVYCRYAPQPTRGAPEE